MAIYGQGLTIQYIAWDTVNNTGKTGDAANHTLRWVKDGVSAAPTNSPSEVDATNAPGVYKITLTSTETSCWVGTLCGKSSSTGVVIMPITLTFERLPTAAPGASGGLPIIGSAPLSYLDSAISGVPANVWGYATRTLTTSIPSASDNAQAVWGYETRTLTATIPSASDNAAAVWNYETRTLTSGGGATAEEIWSYSTRTLTTSIPSSNENAQAVWSYTTRTLTQEIPLASDNAQAVWQYNSRTLTDSVTVGNYAEGKSPQEALAAQGYTTARATKLDYLDASISSRLAANDSRLNNLDAAISSRAAPGDAMTLTQDYDRAKEALKYSEYTAPDNSGISAIKAKTDQLSFVNGDVKATLDGEKVTVQTNEDKTGYTLTSEYDSAKTAAQEATVQAVKTKTDKLQFVEQEGSSLVKAYLEGVQINYDSIADAVWNEPLAEHAIEGSAGEILLSVSQRGVGARTVTVNVKDSNNLPIPLAIVRIKNSANNYLQHTDQDGKAVFALDDGTYSIAVTKSGYNSYIDSITIDSDEEYDITLSVGDILPEPEPGFIVAYSYCYDRNGIPKEGVSVSCKPIRLPGTGMIQTAKPFISQSNANGLVTFPQIKPGGSYQFFIDSRQSIIVKVPSNASSPYELPSFVSGEF